jgi:hypothetical protein
MGVIWGKSSILDYSSCWMQNVLIVAMFFFFEKRLPLVRWDQQFDRLQLVAAQYED